MILLPSYAQAFCPGGSFASTIVPAPSEVRVSISTRRSGGGTLSSSIRSPISSVKWSSYWYTVTSAVTRTSAKLDLRTTGRPSVPKPLPLPGRSAAARSSRPRTATQ